MHSSARKVLAQVLISVLQLPSARPVQLTLSLGACAFDVHTSAEPRVPVCSGHRRCSLDLPESGSCLNVGLPPKGRSGSLPKLLQAHTLQFTRLRPTCTLKSPGLRGVPEVPAAAGAGCLPRAGVASPHSFAPLSSAEGLPISSPPLHPSGGISKPLLGSDGGHPV